jgi:TolB-like protein/Tfp pilus assembly protein PilF
LKKLIHEIHRRSLWQVLGIYLVGSWVALQVVDVLANNFGLPVWFPPFALALLVIGLPIVLATAFVQEGVATGRELPAMSPGAGAAPGSAGAGGLFTWRNAIAGGVAAFALLGVVTAGWWIFGGGPVPEPGIAEANAAGATALRSVAVLPFVTRSAVEEDLYFADGMHDDLLTQLSKIDALTVISRTSVQKYRDTDMGIPAIAEELGVATVMEGGIQRSGNRVRVNVQLIEAATDRHLWAETYDEELTAENLFHIQSDLAQKIAGALRATLTPDVVQRINAQPTTSLEAFDLYSRARYLYERSSSPSGEGLKEALALFQQAVGLDSTYALAWAGIADTYDYGAGRAFDPEEARAAAWPALERALALDPDLAEALSRRGLMHLAEGREDQAQRDFARALELNPGSARVVSRYGGFLSRTGRLEEALVNARRAVELDPISLGLRQNLEDHLWNASLFEEGAQVSRRTLAMEPRNVSSWYNLGWFEGMLGRNDDAIAAFQKAIDIGGEDPSYVSGMAWAHARAGHRDEALGWLARLPEGEGGHDVANAYFELGNVDQAFASLESLLRADPSLAGALSRDPSAARLRAHPRYREVLGKLGLEG